VKIASVILAGGEGSRIGGDKPMRLLGGTTLLDRAIDYASGLSDKVAVAVRDQQVGDAGVAVIRDNPTIEGPLAGLVAALRFASDEDADAVLTLPADMPFLPPDLADRLAEELANNRAAIATSGRDPRICPIPPAIDRRRLISVAEFAKIFFLQLR